MMLKKSGLRSLMIACSCLVVLLLVLGACGPPGTGNTSSSSRSGPPVKGGTWIDDLFEEPNSLIPNASSETFAVMVDQALYAPLFVGDTSGHITPGLATVVPTIANGGISADARTWTFHLRPNLKWSDGMPLDARDVDFSWRLWTNRSFPAASTIGFNLITRTDISPDRLSITFHLKRPFSPFLSVWVDGIAAPMPRHHFQGVAPDKILNSPDNLNPQVVSGPFMMKESNPGDHYTLVRNPMYYLAAEGMPYLDRVVFRIVTNQDTILKDLQAGTIDSAWFLDVSKTIAYQRLSDYTLTSNPNAEGVEAFYFDFHNTILGQHLEVRRAMAMAIDHLALIKTARRGQAFPLCTDHSQGYMPGYEPNAPCPTFDPAAANALLDQYGWKMGADGVRTKNDMRLEFEYATTANNAWRTDDELILQSNFKAIGIKLDIQNYPASTFFGAFLPGGNPSPPTGAVSGRYDIAEFERFGDYDPDDASLITCSQIPPAGFNIAFYCNPALDSLHIAEEATTDPAARQMVFNHIHQVYLTDFPFVVLYAVADIAMHKKSVHNYMPGPAGASETINIWQWWCTNGQC